MKLLLCFVEGGIPEQIQSETSQTKDEDQQQTFAFLLQKDAKYNLEEEAEATQWIEAVLGRDVFGGKSGQDAVHEVLADGRVLVELVSVIK